MTQKQEKELESYDKAVESLKIFRLIYYDLIALNAEWEQEVERLKQEVKRLQEENERWHRRVGSLKKSK